MAYRRNLRDILIILVVAALCYVSLPPAATEVVRVERLTVNGLSLGETPERVERMGLVREPVAYSRSCFYFSRDGRLLVHFARPSAGIGQLEGDRLELGGRTLAESGTSREMVIHHLGRPARSRRKAEVGRVEDYYPDHDLLVRYRGYQLEKVWMVRDSQAWFERGNWPDPISDYRVALEGCRSVVSE